MRHYILLSHSRKIPLTVSEYDRTLREAYSPHIGGRPTPRVTLPGGSTISIDEVVGWELPEMRFGF